MPSTVEMLSAPNGSESSAVFTKLSFAVMNINLCVLVVAQSDSEKKHQPQRLEPFRGQVHWLAADLVTQK